MGNAGMAQAQAPDIFFVTLNWNTTELLARMVKSVDDCTPEPHRWVILDNGSDEANNVELYKWAEAYFSDYDVIPADMADAGMGYIGNPDAVIVQSGKNMGCVLGHNLVFDVCQHLAGGTAGGLGAGNARPHQVVMIDTDVEIVEPGWLTRALAWANERPQVGIVGMEHARAEVCAGAVFLDKSGNWYIMPGQTEKAEPVEGESVGLGLALLRWPVLREGLRFDTGYKIYYKQDDDLCFSVRSVLGLECWAFPVGCIHWGSGSLKANEYDVQDAHGWDEFDRVKQGNQKYFASKWSWALCDRRKTLDEQAQYLEHMKRVMAEKRQAK